MGVQALYLLALVVTCVKAADNPWRWTCEDNNCVKVRNEPTNKDPVLSLDACKMFCGEYGVLWPRPTGTVRLGDFLSKININSIEIHNKNKGKSDDLVQAAGERFKELLAITIPKGLTPKATGKPLDILIEIQFPDVRDFSLGLDESYGLKLVGSAANKVIATITANTFFGARHGLETLSQLVLFDDLRNHLLIVRDAEITDAPVYTYRGILLDTARNYYDVDSIKMTIDGMAAVKLNTFHWHITDSQSFPFVSERRPNLSKFGALSPYKVYTKQVIQDVVKHGLERGVRVLPEFDAPSHVGEGWQDTDLTVCFNAEPWTAHCVEPPCGQLNPIKDELYNYLEDIYSDMSDAFKPDIFHMGGDEVSQVCWDNSPEIVNFTQHHFKNSNEQSFLQLWNYFQKKAQEKAYKAFGKRLPLILWTSTLTDYTHVDQYLNKDDYIIQVWTKGTDKQVEGLLEKGYRLIMSNYDALYLDCGYASWVGAGLNWCAPYIGWQTIYNNSLVNMAGKYKDQILGGEVALWSEQSDSSALDNKLWPRAAAFAERLWVEPESSWSDALNRLLNIRERLVRMGIQADTIQPEWCYQNEGHCK